MTLRPTEHTEAALERLARLWGISKHAATIRAIEETEMRVAGVSEVEALALRSLEQWSDVYKALART